MEQHHLGSLTVQPQCEQVTTEPLNHSSTASAF